MASGKKARKPVWTACVSRKNRSRILNAKVTNDHLGEYVAKIGGHRQVTPIEAMLRRQTGPSAVDTAPFDRSADHEHGIAMSVVGTTIAVFGDGATELRHREHHDVGHAIAEIG